MFQWLGYTVGVSMQVAIISVMLRGSYHSYPLPFLLFICEFLGSIASGAAMFDLGYWTRESVASIGYAKVFNLSCCSASMLTCCSSQWRTRRNGASAHAH